MIKLSVIVVTYNCFDLLRKCIESVYRFNDIGDALEVVVVDNGDDCSYERVKAVSGFERIISFKNENTGYGAGNNAGAAKANGDVFLFLNPDTELIEPVFRFAIERFDNDPKLGCFGVQLVDKNMQPASSGGFRLHMGFLKVQSYRILNRLGIFLPRSMFTSGADLFVKRDAFYESGAFDENIFMYCEEADLCNRLNSVGKNVAYFPERRIIHNEGSTSSDAFPQKYAAVLKSRKYYCGKYDIVFKREAKKELRYCLMKSLLLKYLGSREAAEGYEEVVSILKKEIANCK